MSVRGFELSGIAFVKRIVVGSNNPSDVQSDAKIEEAMALLNRCLREVPKGRILGIEKSFSVLAIGEHSVVLQWTTYHVGFDRKPSWLSDSA